MKYIMAFLLVLLTSLLLIPLAQAGARAKAAERHMVEDVYEAPVGQLFDESEYFAGKTYLSQYVNVVVINKAADAQTLRLYTNRQLILKTKVSTGREDVEYVSLVRGLLRRIGNKGTLKSHWRHTTRGFYTVKRVEDADYRSGESNYQMPYAIFFNEKRGLAVHQVPPDLKGGEASGEAALGKRASSGCVRVHKDAIETIHDAVVLGGRGQIPVLDTRTGAPVLDANGRETYDRGYRTIVIVEEH